MQAVVRAVDRPAGKRRRHRREGRSGGGAETQLGALKVAQLLIDRQPSHGWERNSAFSILRSRTGHRVAVVRRMRGNPRIGMERVPMHGPADHADQQHPHHAIDDHRMAHLAQHPAEHQDQG